MKWKPITKEELEELIENELRECSVPEYIEKFERYRVEPYPVSLERYGKLENVFVVAKKGNEAMYYEDVEEGFNISPIDENGNIKEHWCNQDECWVSVQKWND